MEVEDAEVKVDGVLVSPVGDGLIPDAGRQEEERPQRNLYGVLTYVN